MAKNRTAPLSAPMAQPVVRLASTAGIQSGASSPSAVGHYANQIGVNTNPQPGPKPRQRLRQAPSQKPTAARGRKPSRVAQ